VKEIRSEIEIRASTDRVWRILVDFHRYGEWNPFIFHVSGQAKLGQRIAINLRTPSGRERSYEPVITRLEAGRELRWLGKSVFLRGEHIFVLEIAKPGTTRFVQSEVFKGLLSRFFGEGTKDDISGGFGRMNEALKTRAESLNN
jgi:hypothetical protein